MSSIKLNGFRDLDIGRMLTVLNETYNDKLSFREQISKYLNSRWHDRYEYYYTEKAENIKIAFYSDFYYRKDHIDVFKNFIKEFPDFDYVVPIKLQKERRNLERGFKMIKWDIDNLWKLRSVKMSLKKRLFFIRVLGLSCLYYLKMEDYLNRKDYSYGLVYNDSNPYENILVQFMKQRGIYTATMQHGLFNKYGFWKGLEYRTSVADDFLAWNIYSKELAMECGIPENKIKVLGIPRYIIPVVIKKKGKRGIFSVILGEKALFNENQKLIEFANALSKEQSLKYFIRFHPSCKEDEYRTNIDTKYCITRNNHGETVSEMCEQSDFSLVGSGTSMIIDLIYLKHPFFQFYEQWEGNIYRKRKNYFRNYDELKKQVEKEDADQNNEMFIYYCTTTDVKHSYAEYFSSFQSEQ